LQTLVVRADDSLRSAKRGGRDRVRSSVSRDRRRSVLAALGAAAVGVAIISFTGEPQSVTQTSAADIPHPATTQPQLPTITVPTTITATTTVPAPPPVRPAQKVRKTPTPPSPAAPAPRGIERPPATTRPCLTCDLINSVVGFLPH
jgi:hypothetical protein